ncbi:MAG: hypothetical protein Q7O66_03485, partial [Dehalococcoidia bacterium]|nr:hypothetical protein [Dehalococcoidia bacterium]
VSRVDELQKRYPTIPREVIVKWETSARGVSDAGITEKLGTWHRALGTYQSYDRGQSLKELAQKHPGRVKPGFLLRPPHIFLTKSGQTARIGVDSTSPYVLKEDAPGKFALYEGEEKVQDIFFPPSRPDVEEHLTSKGTPVAGLVSHLQPNNRNCFMIAPVRHCEYFSTGEECKFCNYNSTQEDARAIGLYRPVKANLEETVEAYKIVVSESPKIVEGQIQTGGFTNSDQESKVYLQFVEQIAGSTPYLPNITLRTQPMSRSMMQRLKDAGTGAVSFNLEVWDPEIFAEVCPGKAKHRGRERYLEAYQEAAEVFGWGSVGCDIVGGATMQARNGHATWQEARDSHIEGDDWLIRHGVLPVFLPIRLGAGSVYGNDKSSRAKLAPTEYYLEVALAHHQTMLDTGMYERLNKLMYCPMDCIGPYSGELGMYALAGSVGEWAKSAGIPDDGNWIANFVSTLE